MKNGKTRTGEQRFICKCCSGSFQLKYRYQCKIADQQIIQLTREGCGIRSTFRILGIAQTTLLRRILKIARSIQRPSPILFGKTYQVDELFTYIGNKNNRVCIAYSLEVETGNVINIVVGRRNKTNLNKVISTLLLSDATKSRLIS